MRYTAYLWLLISGNLAPTTCSRRCWSLRWNYLNSDTLASDIEDAGGETVCHFSALKVNPAFISGLKPQRTRKDALTLRMRVHSGQVSRKPLYPDLALHRGGKGSGDYCAFSCLCRVSSLVFETTNQIAGFKNIM